MAFPALGGTAAHDNSGTATAISFSSTGGGGAESVAAASVMVLFAHISTNGTLYTGASVTDPSGFSWGAPDFIGTNAGHITTACWVRYTSGALSGVNPTVTFTGGTASSTVLGIAFESYSGGSSTPLDAKESAVYITGSPSTTPQFGGITQGVAAAMEVCYVADFNSGAVSQGANNSWTIRQSDTTAQCWLLDKGSDGSLGSGTHAAETCMTWDTSHTWATFAVSIAPAPAGGGGTYAIAAMSNQLHPYMLPGAPMSWMLWRPARVLEPVGGGSAPNAFIRTAVDTLTALTDTAARSTQSFLRASTETLTALSETLVRSVSLPRPVSDTLAALSEGVARLLSLVRSPSDTAAAVSDSTARQLSLPRPTADSLAAISESLARVLHLLRSPADTLQALSDVASGIKVVVRTASDNLQSLSDSALRSAQSLLRSISETETPLTDSAGRQLTLGRALSDSLQALTEVASGVKVIVRTAGDSLQGLSDTATRHLALGRLTADAEAAISDSPARAAQAFLRNVADALIGLVDSAVAVVLGRPTFADGPIFAYPATSGATSAFPAIAGPTLAAPAYSGSTYVRPT